MKLPKAEQRRRFEDAARQAGADESGEAFERAFAKIVPPKRKPDGEVNGSGRRSRVAKMERGLGPASGGEGASKKRP